MDEMPGMIRPDLQALPQVKDRMTFLYLEHCTLGRQDGAITVTDFSPHTRGLSQRFPEPRHFRPLFPAYAGVIP